MGLSAKARRAAAGEGQRLACIQKTIASATISGYTGLMTAQVIRDVLTDEKVRIMQAIWEDMRARLLEWDSVKHAVGRG